MLSRQIALISESKNFTLREIAVISAALQKQITRDFSPIWQIDASIDPFESLEDVPLGYWPIIIKDNIGQKNAGGFHLDENGQPYALVAASENTPLACSHEMIEMLVDPFGNRQIPSNSIIEDQGRVNFLVEACDPCEGIQYGYSINGVQVSDFYTPHFFDPVISAAVRYSFNSSIAKPKQVLPGGYITWFVPETGETWQARNFEPNGQVKIVKLGKLNLGNMCWREIIDSLTTKPAMNLNTDKVKLKTGQSVMTRIVSAMAIASSKGRAKNLKAELTGMDDPDMVSLSFSLLFKGGKGGISFDGDIPGGPIVINFDTPNDPNPQSFDVIQTPAWHFVSIAGTAPEGGSISLTISKGNNSIFSEVFDSKENPITGPITYNAGS